MGIQDDELGRFFRDNRERFKRTINEDLGPGASIFLYYTFLEKWERDGYIVHDAANRPPDSPCWLCWLFGDTQEMVSEMVDRVQCLEAAAANYDEVKDRLPEFTDEWYNARYNQH